MVLPKCSLREFLLYVHTYIIWSKPWMLYNAIESSGAAWVQFLTLSMIVHCIHKDEINSLATVTIVKSTIKKISEELPESKLLVKTVCFSEP